MSSVRERRPLLRKRLDSQGCSFSTDDFIEAICITFAQTWHSTDEELVLHPKDAIHFCDAVRHRIKSPKVDDYTILRTLTNVRKNEGKIQSDED